MSPSPRRSARATTRRPRKTRARIVAALGEAALVDAAAVIASFNAFPRVADATGIPLEPEKAEITAAMRDELDLNALDIAGVG